MTSWFTYRFDAAKQRNTLHQAELSFHLEAGNVEAASSETLFARLNYHFI